MRENGREGEVDGGLLELVPQLLIHFKFICAVYFLAS